MSMDICTKAEFMSVPKFSILLVERVKFTMEFKKMLGPASLERMPSPYKKVL